MLYSIKYCVSADPPLFAGPNETVAWPSPAVTSSEVTVPGTPTGVADSVAVFVLFPAKVFATTRTATGTPFTSPVISYAEVNGVTVAC